jgi:drug/metabolite transporter (DMT)-like permease
LGVVIAIFAGMALVGYYLFMKYFGRYADYEPSKIGLSFQIGLTQMFPPSLFISNFSGRLIVLGFFPDVKRALVPAVTAASVDAISAFRQIKISAVTHKSFTI